MWHQCFVQYSTGSKTSVDNQGYLCITSNQKVSTDTHLQNCLCISKESELNKSQPQCRDDVIKDELQTQQIAKRTLTTVKQCLEIFVLW